MKILVVGAGAIGGYFGGRLLAAKRDVTFLVRPARAAKLAATGLAIKSPRGDVHIPSPPTVTAATLARTYDLVILSPKAYDLDAAMDDIAKAVGPDTAILPLLNGMAHLDALEVRFGAAHVLGGQCVIATTLDDEGRVLHLNDAHSLSFGERDGSVSARAKAIEAELTGAGFDAKLSDAIVLEMWEKWVFLATLAGSTCLMRATVGDILAAGGGPTMIGLLDECRAIADHAGYKPRPPFLDRVRAMIGTAGSPLTASMLRDVERGARTEVEHVLGDLVRRGDDVLPVERSLLRLAVTHLRAYEARRSRQAKA